MQISDVLKFMIPEEFGIDEDDSLANNSMEEVMDQIDNTNGDIITAWGVSQFVIIGANWDNVVKIPFKGMFCWDYNFDIYEFKPFRYCKDYCARGYHIYEEAIKEGIEELFAEMDILGHTPDGTPIYTQEKISIIAGDCSLDDVKYGTPETLEKVKELKSKSSCPFLGEWASAAIDCYGIEKFKKMLDFLIKRNLHDFHSENYGYRYDGTPCLIDYSDWLD